MLKRSQGFSLVELIITVALLALLLGMAVPSFSVWIRNAKVRTVAESLQLGARVAQSEAVSRYRQVVYFRTNLSNCGPATTADAEGRFWVVRALPQIAGGNPETLQCGTVSDVSSGVTVTGPTVLCFNSAGRLVANAAPNVGGATCTLDASGTSSFDISSNTSTADDRPMRVLVTLSGSVRMCDPAKTLSATQPDGCPA